MAVTEDAAGDDISRKQGKEGSDEEVAEEEEEGEGESEGEKEEEEDEAQLQVEVAELGGEEEAGGEEDEEGQERDQQDAEDSDDEPVEDDKKYIRAAGSTVQPPNNICIGRGVGLWP